MKYITKNMEILKLMPMGVLACAHLLVLLGAIDMIRKRLLHVSAKSSLTISPNPQKVFLQPIKRQRAARTFLRPKNACQGPLEVSTKNYY